MALGSGFKGLELEGLYGDITFWMFTSSAAYLYVQDAAGRRLWFGVRPHASALVLQGGSRSIVQFVCGVRMWANFRASEKFCSHEG